MRKVHLLSMPALLLSIGLGVFSTSLFAVDNLGIFELDGNADQNGSEPPDDWETLDDGGGDATEYDRIVDKNGTDDIFTGGGSKTPKDPEDWAWKTSPPPPDKDNITNAFAANYVYEGEQILYFGADLFAQNGDAEVAFWFFQSLVSRTGTTMGGFDGHHTDEDVYVAVKFSNGGTKADIAVYEWWEACNKADTDQTVTGNCAADNIRIVIPLGPATCNGSGGDACAISNTANATAHWPYTPKAGVSGIYPPTSFFEGGININAVFGESKCFASFAATTGASTSFNATAKDFALGDFDVCSVGATKTCSNDDEGDDAIGSIVYNVRGCGINDGSGTINLTTLENSIGGGASYTPVDLAWYVPGQVDDGLGGSRDFDPATDCDDGAVLYQAITNGSLVTDLAAEDLTAGEALVYEFSESAVNGAEDTVTLDAVGTDGAPIDAVTATATCPLRTFSASMEVTKQCAADLEEDESKLVVKIVVAGQVCNTGEVQLTGLSLTDEVADGTVTLAADDTTLDPEECTDYYGYYYPSSLPNGDICPFMDMVTATATAPLNTSTGGETGCTVVAGPAVECSADSNSATCDLRAGSGDNDCSTGLLDPAPSP